jgi:hypothetical protein
MVCITLAFWLGRIGLTASGGCCADASGAAQIAANRIAKEKSESRTREIIVSLLLIDFGRIIHRSALDVQVRVSYFEFFSALPQRSLRLCGE